MKLCLFASVWACGSWDSARDFAETHGFVGIEGPVPERRPDLPWIAEVVTGGGYVPHPTFTVDDHCDDFRRKWDAALAFHPVMVTCLGGSDLWPVSGAVEFFGKALEHAAGAGTDVCFETHRSRPTFHPLATREILRQLPGLRLTCDFSHWCCVCEQLVPDTLPGLLDLCAERCGHVHARVGHEQGPQVADPRSPSARSQLGAHLRWWTVLAASAARRGRPRFSVTPEFGPDGYQPVHPGSGRPFLELGEANAFIARELTTALTAPGGPCEP